MRFTKILLPLGLLTVPPILAFGLNLAVFDMAARDVPIGLTDGHLADCGALDDCVTSEPRDGGVGVAPFRFESDPDEAFAALLHLTSLGQGAVIVEATETYARAVFTTAYLKLVDELELRLDAESQVIHVRAFARVDAPWIDSALPLIESLRAQWIARAPMAVADASDGQRG